MGGDTIVVFSLVGKSHPVFSLSVGLGGLGRREEKESAFARACVEVVNWGMMRGRRERQMTMGGGEC